MIPPNELRKIAKGKLKDAQILYKNRRYDGAVYICGYAIEIILKYRITKIIKWKGFPQTEKEFEGFSSFKTHKLEVLLKLSGQEVIIKTNHLADWSIVNKWSPESRYFALGSVTRVQAKDMIDSTSNLINIL